MGRRNRHTSRRESAPGWLFLLVGLGLGLSVAVGVYLRPPGARQAVEPAAASSDGQASSARAAPAPRADTAAAEPAENRFEFYEILPQFEVVVPEAETPAANRARRRAPESPPGSFLLQAGSFSAAADADRLKAQLALLGFESHVQRVTLDDDVFNRVRIGPIADLDAAKRTQSKLRDAGIDSLLMRVPK